MNVDDDIWPVVQQHRWKYQPRRRVVGIIWHATRSGLLYDSATEYSATLNWFRSPNNVVRDSTGNPWYGGMSNYVIGGGRLCRAVPEDLAPRYSAGVHDLVALSVEVAQGRNDIAYDERDIELCHELAHDLANRYGFQLGWLPYVDGNNSQFPGEVGHEDTAQGRSQGKSDPGANFWQAYLQTEGFDVNDKERLARLERIIAANGIDLDGDLQAEVFGEEALKTADERGWSAFLGINLARRELANHVAGQHAAGGFSPADLQEALDKAIASHSHGKGIKL